MMHEATPVTLAPRVRCLACGRRRVVKRGLCRDCREEMVTTAREAYLIQSIRLDAAKTYRQWSQTADAPTEHLLRRAYLDHDLAEVIEMVFRLAFEQGFLSYPGIVARLEQDLEDGPE